MTIHIIHVNRGLVILIHTSVKLVTLAFLLKRFTQRILIHTSVKLVTAGQQRNNEKPQNFNPHEREARDVMQPVDVAAHEILIHTSVKLVTAGRRTGGATAAILIHTSVKLVTPAPGSS